MGDDSTPVTNANCTDEDQRSLDRLHRQATQERRHAEFAGELTTNHLSEAEQLLDEYDVPYLGYIFGYNDIEDNFPKGTWLLSYFKRHCGECDPPLDRPQTGSTTSHRRSSKTPRHHTPPSTHVGQTTTETRTRNASAVGLCSKKQQTNPAPVQLALTALSPPKMAVRYKVG